MARKRFVWEALATSSIPDEFGTVTEYLIKGLTMCKYHNEIQGILDKAIETDIRAIVIGEDGFYGLRLVGTDTMLEQDIAREIGWFKSNNNFFGIATEIVVTRIFLDDELVWENSDCTDIYLV